MMFDYISTGKYWDKPWSLVSGCTRCSPGCEHCWALAMENRFRRPEIEDLITIHPERLDIPLKRKKPTVFSVWNDAFHEDVPFEFIAEAFNIMAGNATQHTYLILTKRPKRMADFFKWGNTSVEPFKNVWLGVTVCNQAEADEKIPLLLQIPAAVRFVSIEPMLGPIDDIGDYFPQYDHRPAYGFYRSFLKMQGIESDGKSVLLTPGIDWVILGTESGPGRRPTKIENIINVVNQCRSAGVPVFVKQVEIDGKTSKNPDEWPDELRSREIPKGEINP